MGTYEVREAVVSILRQAAELECRCERARTLAGLAAEMLRQIAASGLRVTRWRNPEPGPWRGVLHVAGIVIASREYRRSCPGYIVDRRQACGRCARELVRGKFAPWFHPGEPVVTDDYTPAPLQLEPWRRVGGTIWEECTPRRVSDASQASEGYAPSA